MRHRKQRGKLERPAAHRKALVRNMVTSLLEYELIETTDAKAKVLRRMADRMITLGKRGTLHARRRALAVIRDREVTEKVFDELAARYAARPGGYTRVLKTRQRVGDAAPMSIVELVDRQAGGGMTAKDAKQAGKAKGEAKPGKQPRAEAGKTKAPKAETPPKAEKAAKPAKAPKPAKPAKPKGAAPGPKGGGGRRGSSRQGQGGRPKAK
jgi:large subunit ribosomal protein L17